MACDLTTGRSEPCKDGLGGITKVYAMDYVAAGFTVAAGEATAINADITEVFPWDLRSDTNNDASEAPVSSRDNGSTTFTQTLNMRLKKQDAATATEVSLMAYGRPIFVVVDRNGVHKVFGLSEGMDLTGGNIQSGTAKGDFNGYDLTFESVEGSPAPILDSSTVTALEALISETVIAP